MVRIVAGDSATTPLNTMSTGGSRASTMASGAAVGATRMVKDMVLAIAANMLEANEADLEIDDSTISVRGTPTKSVELADVARAAWFAPSSLPEGLRQGLEATCDFKVPPTGGWTAATHCCWVEIDPETGSIAIPRYLVVEDCGTLINPAVVDGQIIGGVMQGIAQTLYERHVYDDDGHLLTSSFADYLVPSAADLPSIEIEHMEFEPLHEINSRGVGEGGMIGAPAAHLQRGQRRARPARRRGRGAAPLPRVRPLPHHLRPRLRPRSRLSLAELAVGVLLAEHELLDLARSR